MLLTDHEDHGSMGDDARLDALFRAYRQAVPDPEPSADFMPRLWQKIEARERVPLLFGKLARNLVTIAVALSVMMAVAVSLTRLDTHVYSKQSYVEVLEANDLHENLDNFAPVHVEPVSDMGYQR
ncbi:MAG: hypothetical protein HYX25_04620 [Candidatus Solibacter usitatus]|nr:hypothetical protein [Candidatus Solibacter usitatus]